MKHLLLEPVPKRLGWSFCLGSMLLFLAVIQVITGLALTLGYAPTPDHAHQSVDYFSAAVLFGRMVRGIHHWSASAMVVLAVLHMLRVIFWGSYKRPREATWLAGVCLLLVTLAFSFTGYLLPWDQRAYWATVVGTRIAGTVPFIGDFLVRLLRGGEEVGAPTLTRFFATHVILLPLLLFLFMGIHLFLVRRHGSSGHWSLVEGVKAEKEPFYPRQFRRDVLASLLLLGVVFGLAIVVPPHLGPIADPADTQVVPRPEWYFLGFFQMLHYFTGHAEILGTVVIPVLLVLLLFSLPWLDRSIQRNPFRRPWVSGLTVCALLLAGTLTVIPELDDLHDQRAQARMDRLLPTLSPPLRQGYALYQRYSCDVCHGVDGSGRPSGPSLLGIKKRRSAQYIGDHIRDPQQHNPRSRMPKTQLSDADLDLLVQYLLKN
jgi:ubiquinol-cytochrome c reductase cytochrome b subunit